VFAWQLVVNMRLCWAEKIPLALFTLIALTLFFLGQTTGSIPDTSEFCRQLRLEHPGWTSQDSYCFVTAGEHWGAFFSILGFLAWKFVLPLWAVTRILDVVVGGPAIRRYRRVIRRGGTIEEARLASTPEPERARYWLRRLKRPDRRAADSADKAWLQRLEESIDPSGSLSKRPRLDLTQGEWKRLSPD
jgi:hypothetical protein